MIHFPRLLPALVLPLLLLCAACGQSDEEMIAAYKRGDYASAFVTATKKAEAGDVIAESLLGTMYFSGNGVSRNYEEARKWWTVAANAGARGAQNNLGLMFLYGQGVDKDATTAAAWFIKAAEQGDALSQNALGVLYYAGIGVEKNQLRAWHWFLAAAKQNLPVAEFNLGALYEQQTLRVRYDDPLVLDFFKETSTESTMADLEKRMPQLQQEGKAAIREFDVEPSGKLALEWYQKAVDQGVPAAQLNLANLYLRGRGTEQDYDAALNWYLKAAASADKPEPANIAALFALANLATMYRYGWGVQADQDKANEFAHQAKARGITENPFFKAINKMSPQGLLDPACEQLCIGTFTMGPSDAAHYNTR